MGSNCGGFIPSVTNPRRSSTQVRGINSPSLIGFPIDKSPLISQIMSSINCTSITKAVGTSMMSCRRASCSHHPPLLNKKGCLMRCKLIVVDALDSRRLTSSLCKSNLEDILQVSNHHLCGFDYHSQAQQKDQWRHAAINPILSSGISSATFFIFFSSTSFTFLTCTF